MAIISKKTISEKVMNGAVKEAIKDLFKLSQAVDDDTNNEVILLSSRFNSLQKRIMSGMINYESATMQENQIVHALNYILDRISDDASVETEEEEETVRGLKTGPSSSGAPAGNIVIKPQPSGDRPKTEGPRKILFISASPKEEDRLQTDLEHRRIRDQLERGRSRDNFEFLHPRFSVTITELLRAKNEKPNIFHFAGHGGTGGIFIATEDNKAQPVPLAALVRLFKSLQGITEVVLLNACYSAEQAKVISQYGMYVVGNNLPITDKAAISFSEGFYNGLGEGLSFEDAFNDAMMVVLTQSPDAADIIEVWKDGEKVDI